METRIWHPLCLNTNLGAAPLAITLLGEDLVLWRDASGSPVLMKNQCPHRGARLSLGRVRGNTLECPYHGWQFDPVGACVAIPAVPDFRPPASHRACTYRVARRPTGCCGACWVRGRSSLHPCRAWRRGR
jgi:phenylpropionate dioxygenase-like ring-hydroxylating dioxygenase large terminal subunit